MELFSRNVFIGFCLVLGLLYAGLFYVSEQGWGYMGYYGYNNNPSFFYWGRPSIYLGRNVRAGSLAGPGHTGGGTRPGK